MDGEGEGEMSVSLNIFLILCYAHGKKAIPVGCQWQRCDLHKWGKEDEIEKLRLDIVAAEKKKKAFECWHFLGRERETSTVISRL